MRPCPNGTRKAWREMAEGASPCVVWAPGVVEEIIYPDSAAAERMCRVGARTAWPALLAPPPHCLLALSMSALLC